MNELDRIKKLAGILTESVMAVPGIGIKEDEADMQTAASAADDSADAAADAAEPQLTEQDDNDDGWAEHKAEEYEKNKDLEDGSEFDPKLGESAPPGMEDMVLKLEKQYPGEEEKAFATAWSIYNKKHGETEEAVDMVHEENDQQTISAMNRFADLINSWVDYDEALDVVTRELDQAGIDADKIDEIVNAINVEYGDVEQDTDPGSMDGDFNSAMASAGHGTDEDYYDYGSEDMYEGDPDIPMDQHLAAKERERERFRQQFARDDVYRRKADADKNISDYNRNAEPAVAEDLNNGYDDIEYANGQDYFPDGADSPVTTKAGPSGARQGDNPEQKKMEIAETHKELVYNYRKFLKESVTK